MSIPNTPALPDGPSEGIAGTAGIPPKEETLGGPYVPDLSEVPELAELRASSGHENELTPDQNAIRDLVYGNSVHFFSRRDLRFVITNGSTYIPEKENIERVITEKELTAAIINGIVINSTDNEEEQRKQWGIAQSILSRGLGTFDTFVFRNGQYSIDNFIDGPEGRRLYAKMFLAGAITNVHNNSFWNAILDIRFLTQQGLISAADIIEVQNIVTSTIQTIPEAQRPEMVDIMKQIISYERGLERSASRGFSSPHDRDDYRMFNADEIHYADGGTISTLSVEEKGVNDRYVSYPPQYYIEGQEPKAITPSPNRLQESLDVAKGYRELVVATLTTSPDFRAIMAENLRYPTPDESLAGLEPLRRATESAQLEIYRMINRGADEFATYERELVYIQKEFARTDLSGLFSGRNRQRVLDDLFTDGTTTATIIREIPMTHLDVDNLLQGKLDATERDRISQRLAEIVAAKIEDIKRPALTALLELDGIDPMVSITPIVNIEAETVTISEYGRTRTKPIYEMTAQDVKSVATAYSSVAAEFSKIPELAPRLLESLRDEHGITYSRETGLFSRKEDTTIRETNGRKFLLEVLNKLVDISRRGKSGQAVAEHLTIASQSARNNILGRKNEIVNGAASVFPAKVLHDRL